MKIIETGKYKGKTLIECPKEYLEWAAKHEKNFAKRNQWISRDARFILARLAEGKVFCREIQEWVTLPSDESADVHNVEKYLGNWYGIQRQIKNREKAQMLQEAREIRRRRAAEDLGTRGNLNTSRAFSLMR